MLIDHVLSMLTYINIWEKIVSYGIILNSGSKSSQDQFKKAIHMTRLVSKSNIVFLISDSSGYRDHCLLGLLSLTCIYKEVI